MRVNGNYVVSFNTFIDGYEVGEPSNNTVDYVGKDTALLAEEVIKGDPGYPMKFEFVERIGSVVGVFKNPDHGVCAVMYIS